jgi:DNA-binding LytR/AlgR family response regulator
MQILKKISCLIIDDEPPAIDVLVRFITAVSSLELVGTCNNALEAMEFLQQHEVDLLFLDIQMPQLKGTDLIKILHQPPKIIFTTAFRKFALEGFELNAVDYLLKPISFERFLKAINKVTSLFFASMLSREEPKANDQKNDEAALCIRADRKMLKIPFQEILYVESIKDYVKIFTTGKTVISKLSISALEEMLPGNLFVRVHRSYIVAIKKVGSFTAELAEIGRYAIPISRMYRLEAEKKLKSQ